MRSAEVASIYTPIDYVPENVAIMFDNKYGY